MLNRGVDNFPASLTFAQEYPGVNTIAVMDAAAALKTQDDKFHNLGLTKAVVNKEQVNCYSRALDTASTENPILVLIHGYPQSAFMLEVSLPTTIPMLTSTGGAI
jgi:hypothetical protein